MISKAWLVLWLKEWNNAKFQAIGREGGEVRAEGGWAGGEGRVRARHLPWPKCPLWGALHHVMKCLQLPTNLPRAPSKDWSPLTSFPKKLLHNDFWWTIGRVPRSQWKISSSFPQRQDVMWKRRDPMMIMQLWYSFLWYRQRRRHYWPKWYSVRWYCRRFFDTDIWWQFWYCSQSFVPWDPVF